MKPHGAKCEFEKRRNAELLHVYRELLHSARSIKLSEIFTTLVSHPASRFWVSEERAAIVIAAMMRNPAYTASMRPQKREMFEEIYRRAMKLYAAHPERTILEIAEEVVHQPAPKFYLTPGTAEVLISKAKRQCYEEKKRKLRHLF